MGIRIPACELFDTPDVFGKRMDDPDERQQSCEIGIVRDHRFAFYFWSRWFVEKLNRDYIRAPLLITIDWHQDLAPPNDNERDDLNNLDPMNKEEVLSFCQDRMNPFNDGHILSAAWMGIISDIVVVCKQKFRSPDQFRDFSGKSHSISKFTSFDAAHAELEKYDRVILDIDLDYFTESESFRGGDPDVRLDSEEEIRSVLNPHSDFFQSVFKRFLGMTIATEPGFCGSIENARHILTILNDQFFDAPLTDPECSWKHLSEK